MGARSVHRMCFVILACAAYTILIPTPPKWPFISSNGASCLSNGPTWFCHNLFFSIFPKSSRFDFLNVFQNSRFRLFKFFPNRNNSIFWNVSDITNIRSKKNQISLIFHQIRQRLLIFHRNSFLVFRLRSSSAIPHLSPLYIKYGPISQFNLFKTKSKFQ